MTINNNVSFLAQSTVQSARLSDLRATFDELQRQVTTQKKSENYAGLGTDATNVQRLHNMKSLTDSYLKNMTSVSNRMSLMSSTMTQISDQAKSLVSTVNNMGGATNIGTINQVAQQALDFIADMTNQQLDGRYLFAGSDSGTPPYTNVATAKQNMSQQVTQWLSGASSTTAFLSNTDGMSATNLGLSSGLATSGAVTARISQNMDVDYTVKADDPAFQDIINACAFLANLKQPDAANGDVATTTDFNTAVQHAVDLLNKGMQAMDGANQSLSSKFALIGTIKDQTTSDNALLQTQIDGIENIDPNTAIINLQSLENQLTASYQVTNIVGKLSLTNFM